MTAKEINKHHSNASWNPFIFLTSTALFSYGLYDLIKTFNSRQNEYKRMASIERELASCLDKYKVINSKLEISQHTDASSRVSAIKAEFMQEMNQKLSNNILEINLLMNLVPEKFPISYASVAGSIFGFCGMLTSAHNYLFSDDIE